MLANLARYSYRLNANKLHVAATSQVSRRLFNTSGIRLHKDDHHHDEKTNKIPNIVINKSSPLKNEKVDIPKGKGADDKDDEDMEEMFVQGPAGLEWGGPTRGGKRPEPTRYGDWERKGRVSDFQ